MEKQRTIRATKKNWRKLVEKIDAPPPVRPARDADLDWRSLYVDPLLAFAGMKVIDIEKINALFFPTAFASQFWFTLQPEYSPARAGQEKPYARLQQEVRRWASLLMNAKPAARRRVQEEVAAMLPVIALRGRATFERGTLKEESRPILDEPLAAIIFGMAILADEAAARWARLQVCELKNCGRFFLRAAKSRQRFCSTSHAQRHKDFHSRGKGRGEA